MKRTGLMLAVFGLFVFAQVARADWSAVKRLTWNSGFSEYPAVAVDSSGNVHVVWADYTPGNLEIFYKKSTDGGFSWMPNQRITWNSGSSVRPDIAVDSSDQLHVVWSDFMPGNLEIYYKKSTNGGFTWMPSQRITWNSGDSSEPAIAVDSSGDVHVVWFDDTPGNMEIFYKKSTDEGSMWMPSQRIAWNSSDSECPSIAVNSSGNLHVVWDDATQEIYYRKSTDEGSMWMPSQRITWNLSWSRYSDIAVDSSENVHVVWGDDTAGNLNIYYKKSTNGGATWMPSQRITWNSGWSDHPAITVDLFDNLHMVWFGLPSLTSENLEIYYRKSTDGGSMWSPSQRITWNEGNSEMPQIAVDSSGNVHVVWSNDTPAFWKYEIYYRRYIK